MVRLLNLEWVIGHSLISALISLSLPLLVITNASLFSGCARAPNNPQGWLQEGSQVISRPLPPATAEIRSNALGFAPTNNVHSGTWIVVHRSTQKIDLMNGASLVESLPVKNLGALQSGEFQVVHKQRNPLWHAPSSYFTQRHLNAPPDGHKDRFLRGAMGDFVVFLAKDLPLHSGPIWVPELGGVQLEDNAISKIYYSLQIGSAVEVR